MHSNYANFRVQLSFVPPLPVPGFVCPITMKQGGVLVRMAVCAAAVLSTCRGIRNVLKYYLGVGPRSYCS